MCNFWNDVQAVKAMQFPDEDNRRLFETYEASKNRAMLDEAYAKAVMEDDEYDDSL